MTDTTTLTPVAEQTPSTTDFIRCPGRCRWNIKVGTGFVPNIRRAYWMIRKTDPTRVTPLTRSEVLSLEMCQACAKHVGYETVTTVDMLAMMDGWAYENIRRKNVALDTKAAFAERQRVRDLQYAIKNEHKSPINRLFATVKIADEKPRPKRRTHHHVPPTPRSTEKRYGNERQPVVEEVSKSPKKNKKKEQQQAQGNKKRGGR